jgi:NTE family protein
MGVVFPDAGGVLSAAAYQTLSTLPALRGLGETDRERVAALFREEELPKGTVVFREGDVAASLYIVASGQVRVDIGREPVAHLGQGEWFGEMALITGAPRSATVEVTADCRLLVLDHRAFADLLAAYPALYEQLAAILSRRLARTSRGEGRRPGYEVVLIENRGRWPDAVELVDALVASLERELGRPVAVVRVGTNGGAPASDRGLHAVVAGTPGEPEKLRDRLGERLATLGSQAPLVVVLLEDACLSAADILGSLADSVLVLAEPGTAPDDRSGVQRRIALYDRRRGSAPPQSGSASAVLPRTLRRRSAAIDRLARCLTHRSIGLALGSGAAYGLAHIGVLAVLEEAGIPIDFVAGASMGAIIGAGYALGMSPADLRDEALRFAGLRTLLPMLPSFVRMALDMNLVSPGIFSGEQFLRFLASFCPLRDGAFTDLRIPFRAVATDIETGARVEIGDGPLVEALRASFSAPWIFTPHKVVGRALVDGGMVDPVPSETVRSMGADVVIAVNVVPALDPRAPSLLDFGLRMIDRLNPLSYIDRRPLNSSFDVVMKCLLIMQHELGNARCNEADVLINPKLGDRWFLEFWAARAFIERGTEAARAALPAIEEKLRSRARGPEPLLAGGAAPPRSRTSSSAAKGGDFSRRQTL